MGHGLPLARVVSSSALFASAHLLRWSVCLSLCFRMAAPQVFFPIMNADAHLVRAAHSIPASIDFGLWQARWDLEMD